MSEIFDHGLTRGSQRLETNVKGQVEVVFEV